MVNNHMERNRDRRERNAVPESEFRGQHLVIQPGDQLMFENKGPEFDGVDFILLTNKGNKCVAFKVKTTAPEKFRVKPSFGCIDPGTSKSVEVTIQQGFLQTAQRDKFLVLSAPVEASKSSDELIQFWHDIAKEDSAAADQVEEHRLRCQIVNTTTADQFEAGDLDQNGVPVNPPPSMIPSAFLTRLDAIDAKVDLLMQLQKAKPVPIMVPAFKSNYVTLALAIAVVFAVFQLLKGLLSI
ncbi:hypothetical protein RvY_13678 [Ramazzottius varieornatus]|uniref:MSP domain-containing protein n=1 Tax=Ramazzottius varieornatus TaxID=947166 RepID=A0A1D1VX85_RAMVA|nr:hypothetical protein RvY_13678 [Ramazzottius varieornatus]